MLASKHLFPRRTDTPATTPTETDTASRLRLATGRLWRGLRDSTQGSGLTPTETSVLFNVARCGRIGMSELARDEDLNPTMLSRIVARLADRGLLAREQHPDDGRAVVVVATDGGIAKRDELRRARTDALAHELEGLTADEAAALDAALPVLERLGATLRPRT